jgi:hypothetical protein
MSVRKVAMFENEVTRIVNGEERSFTLPRSEGDFALYSRSVPGTSLSPFLYISGDGHPDLERKLADVRVLMEECSRGQNAAATFVVASNADYSSEGPPILESFEAMKKFVPSSSRKLFSLELWDGAVLLAKEHELGIRIQRPATKTAGNA